MILFKCRRRGQASRLPEAPATGELRCWRCGAVLPTKGKKVHNALCSLLLCALAAFLSFGCKSAEEKQAELARMAISSSSQGESREAVERLTDQKLLAQVASDATEEVVRGLAIEKLNDQDALAHIAVEAKTKWLRERAIEGLTDQSMLASIAIQNDADGVELDDAFFKKIKDQKLLGSIATNGHTVQARWGAISKLEDQELIDRIAVQDENWAVRKLALSKTNNQRLVETVVFEDKDYRVRLSAIGDLKDEVLLSNVAIRCGERILARHEQTNLPMMTVLDDVEDQETGLSAVDKISDRNLLKDVGVKVLNTVPGIAALGRIDLGTDFESVSRKVSNYGRIRAEFLARSFIDGGEERRVPELKRILLIYGTEAMSQCYLNCGKKGIEDAGSAWAMEHGYIVLPTGVEKKSIWGSKRQKP
jgi:hypothetical protein